MGCKLCDEQHENPDGVYYLRIGNPDIGFGNIGIIGCEQHVKLLFDRLREWYETREATDES